MDLNKSNINPIVTREERNGKKLLISRAKIKLLKFEMVE